MKRHLFMALAMASMLHPGTRLNASIDGDTAAKGAVHATSVTGKSVARGTTAAADKTTHATSHAVKETGSGIKKGTWNWPRGQKGATKQWLH